MKCIYMGRNESIEERMIKIEFAFCTTLHMFYTLG